MDFPAKVTANIQRIEGVDTVNWSQWARTGEQRSNFPNVEDNDEVATIAAVYSLRELLNHVYWDTVGHQIWLFGLPLLQHADHTVALLVSHGFSRRSHGTLKAADFQSTKAPDAEVENVTSHDAPTKEPDSYHLAEHASSRFADIYDKAMDAISSTCAQRLATMDDWIQIGTSVCINLTPQRNELLGRSWHDVPSSHSDRIEFRSRWNANGRLIIFWDFSQSERLSSVAHYMRSAQHDLDSGTPLLLSPSGVHVIYRDILSIADDRRGFQDLDSSKSRCTSYLNHQGFSVPPNADWVVVEFPSSSSLSPDVSPELAHSLLTLWPAKLALCKISTVDQNRKDPSGPSFSEGMDPVARAKSWFSVRAARTKNLQTYLEEINSKARQQQPPEPEVSDHETLSVIGSTPMPDAVPHDVSGIYPTPSDGLLSQPSETPVSYAQQDLSPTLAHADQTVVDYVDSEYHDTRDDEIFDDMDMVGEADFNFFDEPGVQGDDSSDILQHAQSQKAIITKEVGDPSVAMFNVPSPATRRGGSKEAGGESAREEHGEYKVPDSSFEQAVPNTEEGDSFPEVDPVEDASCLSDLKPQQGTDEQALALRAQDPSKNIDKMLLKRGLFNPVWSTGLELDHKYVNNGRFGHPPGALSGAGMTLLRERDEHHQIPRIGLNHQILTSTDSKDKSNEEDDHVDDDSEDDEDDENDEDGNEVDDDDDNNNDDNDNDDDDDEFNHIKMRKEKRPNATGHDNNGDIQLMGDGISRKWKSAANGSVSLPATPASPDLGSGNLNQQLVVELCFPPNSFFIAATGQTLSGWNLRAPAVDRPFYTSKEHSFIQVAQLLADQVVREHDRSSELQGPSSTSRFHAQTGPFYQNFLRPMLSMVSPTAEACSLLDLVSDNDEKSETVQDIFKLENLHMRIQRMETMADILPSANSLWEGLSLCPSSGPKDVYAFFLFPDIDYLVQPSRVFLEMIKDAYQSCNLGNHNIDGQQSAYPHGLVPIPVMLGNTRGAFARLGKYLARLRLCRGNFIIYMLDTSDDVKALPGHCTGFLDLFHCYRSACEDEDLRDPNDLALQIIPSSIVFTANKLVLPSAANYKRLAFQVYDRCGPTRRNGEDPVSPFDVAPAICLSKPIPRAIDFVLAPDTSSALLDQEDCLHLAYKWETGEQWLTASWTNNLGTIQWNAAYWLSKDDGIEQSFPQAAVAMFEVTIKILHKSKVPYKIAVAKYGKFEAHELETWCNCKVEGAPRPAFILLEVNPTPSLKLFHSGLPTIITELSDFPTTPASTPLAAGQSPDTSMQNAAVGNAGPQSALPANIAENDVNSRLIDITDETWAIIPDSAKVQITENLDTKSNLSGYLVKRAGTRDEDGLLLVQVDLVQGAGFQQQSMKPHIMAILKMYGNLASLARARSIVDPANGTLPIHIAAAGNAHAALCRSMYYAS